LLFRNYLYGWFIWFIDLFLEHTSFATGQLRGRGVQVAGEGWHRPV